MCNKQDLDGQTVEVDIGKEHPIDVDGCIAGLVKALNYGGYGTVASCCGHNAKPGIISLEDGRQLLVAPDFLSGMHLSQMSSNIYPWKKVKGYNDKFLKRSQRHGFELFVHRGFFFDEQYRFTTMFFGLEFSIKLPFYVKNYKASDNWLKYGIRCSRGIFHIEMGSKVKRFKVPCAKQQ